MVQPRLKVPERGRAPQNQGFRNHLSTRLRGSSRSRLLTSNFIPCAAASSTLKSGHLLARLRGCWFLPEKKAARYSAFSSLQAARLVSVPVSPPHPAVHRRPSQPAQGSPRSE